MKTKTKVKTLVVGWDLHYPYHNKESVSAMFQFIEDMKPDIFIIGGDWLDMDLVSHWNDENPRAKEGQRLKGVYDGFNKEILLPLEKLSNWTEKVYLAGNHEMFLQQFIDKQPQMEGLVEWDTYLKLKERGWKIIPENGHYTVGRSSYIHGWYTNMMHSKKTIETWGQSECVFYGHCHDIQCYSQVYRGSTGLPRIAQSCGCLCNKNPVYLRNKPNKWCHAFLYATIREDGTFTAFVIPIINGVFSWDRKTYIGK